MSCMNFWTIHSRAIKLILPENLKLGSICHLKVLAKICQLVEYFNSAASDIHGPRGLGNAARHLMTVEPLCRPRSVNGV